MAVRDEVANQRRDFGDSHRRYPLTRTFSRTLSGIRTRAAGGQRHLQYRLPREGSQLPRSRLFFAAYRCYRYVEPAQP
jgi:hypothetical protein